MKDFGSWSDMREIAINIEVAFLGLPYVWGGDDPIAGFDCSGLQIEALKSVGVLPGGGDWTAQDLLDYFGARGKSVNVPYRGCLVFYIRNSRAVHVEMLINDSLSIGSSGGGKGNMTRHDAVEANAYVKIRPYKNRSGPYVFVDPFIESRGL